MNGFYITDEGIMHYGVKRKSGRYPYGSGNRPFQHIRGFFNRRKRAKIIEASNKKKQEEARKQLEAENKLRQFQQNKERLMTKGTAEEVLANKDYFTNNELEYVLQRMNKIATLNAYKEKAHPDAFAKMDKFMDKVGMVSRWANTGVNAYRNVQQIRQILDGAFTVNVNQNNKR